MATNIGRPPQTVRGAEVGRLFRSAMASSVDVGDALAPSLSARHCLLERLAGPAVAQGLLWARPGGASLGGSGGSRSLEPCCLLPRVRGAARCRAVSCLCSPVCSALGGLAAGRARVGRTSRRFPAAALPFGPLPFAWIDPNGLWRRRDMDPRCQRPSKERRHRAEYGMIMSMLRILTAWRNHRLRHAEVQTSAAAEQACIQGP